MTNNNQYLRAAKQVGNCYLLVAITAGVLLMSVALGIKRSCQWVRGTYGVPFQDTPINE